MKRNVLLFVLPLLVFSFATAEEKDGDAEAMRGWLGVFPENLSEPMRIALNIDHGVLVNEVLDESPAAGAGFEKGDVILELDGVRVEDASGLRFAIRERPTSKVDVQVRRRGKPKRIGVTLGERKSSAISIGGNEYDPEDAIHFATKALKRIGPEVEKQVRVKIIEGDEIEMDLDDLREELEELREELEEELEELREELKLKRSQKE